MMIMKDIVDEIKILASQYEEELPCGVDFDTSIYGYDFEGKIQVAPKEFWRQYREFVELLDGFDIDGFCIFGIKSHFEHGRVILDYNRKNTEIAKNSPALTFDDYQYCIIFGDSSMDIYTYDVRTNKWESRDRFQYDNLFISCDTLTEFLMALIPEIRG
ncbi:Uncharacterised protein [Serratia rubidaea]|nr:Uncharacterised protein [Serratia rubidaea]